MIDKNAGLRKKLNILGRIFFESLFTSLIYILTLGAANFFTVGNYRLTDVKDFGSLFSLAVVSVYVFLIPAFWGTPFVAWALRAGKRNFLIYGSLLWLLVFLCMIFSKIIFKENYESNILGWLFLMLGAGFFAIGFAPPQEIVRTNFRNVRG